MRLFLATALIFVLAGCQSQPPAPDPRIAELQSQLDNLKAQNADLQEQQAAVSDIQKRPKLTGRYYTPDTLIALMNNPATERAGQLYLLWA
jgi:hypothetical protein